MIFDTDPLPETLDLLGAPVAVLELSVNRPSAMVAVRLSDVAPDGQATRVSYGVHNLNHVADTETARELNVGEKYSVAVQLNGMAQSFPAGHRLRLSISTSYWPVVWPPPEPVRMTVYPEQSYLSLPLREVSEGNGRPVPSFGEPEGAAPIPITQVEPGEQDWTVSRNMVDLTGALDVVKDLGVVRIEDIGLDVTRRSHERYTYTHRDFNSVRGETDWVMGFARDEWNVHTTTRTVLTSTPTEFRLYAQLDAYEGDERVFARTWNTTMPRDHI